MSLSRPHSDRLTQIYKRLTMLYGVSPSRLHSAAVAAVEASWHADDPRGRESFRALFNQIMPDVDEYFLTLSRHAGMWPPALPLPLSTRVPWDAPLYPESCLCGSDDSQNDLGFDSEIEIYTAAPSTCAAPEPGGSSPRDAQASLLNASAVLNSDAAPKEAADPAPSPTASDCSEQTPIASSCPGAVPQPLSEGSGKDTNARILPPGPGILDSSSAESALIDNGVPADPAASPTASDCSEQTPIASSCPGAVPQPLSEGSGKDTNARILPPGPGILDSRIAESALIDNGVPADPAASQPRGSKNAENTCSLSSHPGADSPTSAKAVQTDSSAHITPPGPGASSPRDAGVPNIYAQALRAGLNDVKNHNIGLTALLFLQDELESSLTRFVKKCFPDVPRYCDGEELLSVFKEPLSNFLLDLLFILFIYMYTRESFKKDYPNGADTGFKYLDDRLNRYFKEDYEYPAYRALRGSRPAAPKARGKTKGRVKAFLNKWEMDKELFLYIARANDEIQVVYWRDPYR